ncbi:rhodanese-like domain-containing protein, partial [Planococcus sp. SIMBA_160]
SGMRSMQAAKILKKQGFTYITNIKGGMNAWRSKA